MNSIRFVKNIVLATEFHDEKMDVAYSFGSIYPVESVKQRKNGFCNIVIADGTIINGVSRAVFECMGGFQPELIEDPPSDEINVEDIEIIPVKKPVKKK